MRQVIPAWTVGNSAARWRPKLAMKPSACALVRVRSAPDETDPGGASIGLLPLRESERPEEVVRTQMAPVVDGRRQHADDLVGFTVHRTVRRDVGVRAEAILPSTGG